MKVSAALQLLTTVMSGTSSSSSSPDDIDDCWSAGLPHQHVGQPPASLEFLLPRAELDLGACLDVETLEELPPAVPAMYTTPHSSSGPNPSPRPLYSGQALSAWVDNVIDMTSPPSELTSSGEHTITTSTTSTSSGVASSVGVVPNAGELSGGLSAGHQGFSAAVDNFDFNGFMEEEDFPGTDNATFLTMGDALTMSAAVAAAVGAGGSGGAGADSSTTAAAAMDLADAEACSVLDFAQFGSLSSAALTSTTTTSTIDLTALEQFVTLDSAHLTQSISSISNSNINNININNNNNNTLEDSLGDLSNSNSNLNSNLSSNSNSINSNIPSTLWNMDLTLPVSEELEGVSSSGTCGRQQHQQQQGADDVKVTLKNRLYSRGSLNSVSQDSDVIISSCSLRSPASSTSSLTQSLEDEDADDPVKMLEKREKNRLAAQKCRNRKRDKAENLQKNVSRLEERQEKLKEEVRKLRDERETLEEIVNIHSIVCPKIRKLSTTTSADS